MSVLLCSTNYKPKSSRKKVTTIWLERISKLNGYHFSKVGQFTTGKYIGNTVCALVVLIRLTIVSIPDGASIGVSTPAKNKKTRANG